MNPIASQLGTLSRPVLHSAPGKGGPAPICTDSVQNPSLRFQVSEVNGRPHVLPVEAPRPASPTSRTCRAEVRRRRKRKFVEVKRGSVTVRIYKTPRGRYHSHTLVYYEAGQRKREVKAKLEEAIARAEDVATRIANGETQMLGFTQSERGTFLRICELAAPTGKPPELCMAEYADLLQQLKTKDSTLNTEATLQEAVRFFLENRPRGIVSLPIPALVAKMLAEREKEISARWYRALEQQLERFAAHFTGPLHTLTSADINTWLNQLTASPPDPRPSELSTKNSTLKTSVLSPCSRSHYRAAVLQLAAWARDNGHLPRTWVELEHVKKPKSAIPADTRILTPEEMTSLLSTRRQAEQCGRAPETLMPFLLLGGFAGIRHEEMNGSKALLNWSHVDLDARQIYVHKGVAKTGRDRIVPISDNLAAWLLPYARPNGPLCPFSNTSGALCKAKARAGIQHGRDQTPNILRKSFISYRKALIKNVGQVADEAGNTPAIIRKYYDRPIPETEAKRYFNIWPTSAGIIQLSFALK
jgi:integrase